MGRAMLFLVSGMVIVTGIIQAANNQRTSILPERSQDYFYEQQARNESISLVDLAIEHMKKDNEWEDSLSSGNQSQGEAKLYTYSSVTVPNELDHSVDEWNQYRVLLLSTSEYMGYTVETEVLMQRDSFSKYSYFTEREMIGNYAIYWYTGDEVTGPIHTNGTFRMSGTPTFHGDISSPNMWVKNTQDTEPNFYGNTDFNASENNSLLSADLESQVDNLASEAASGGISLNGDKDIEFYVEDEEGYIRTTEEQSSQETVTFGCSCYYDAGNYDSCQDNGYGRYVDVCTVTNTVTTEVDVEYMLSDYNGIISVDGEATIEGEVKGQVTLHATDDIFIGGDITYYTSPLDDETSLDIFGIVSEEDVVIERNAHSASGTQDIDIHASIMALGESFEVEDHDDSGFRGDINLLGGIIQVTRGAVGTFGGQNGVTGYSKNYVYDSRLRSMTPPLYPRESIFSIVYWKDKVVERPDN